MFGIFGVTRDANKAQGFLLNFVNFTRDTFGIFGMKKGFELISQSEWAAGPQFKTERNVTLLTCRLAVPFSSFYGTIDDDTLSGMPSDSHVNIRIDGNDEFLGFGLMANSESELIRVYALNPHQGRATARAAMLMARFKSRGATDISNALKGNF